MVILSEETNICDNSGEENFADALDGLIDTEEDVSTRKRINSPLQELSSSDLEYSIKVRQKYGLAESKTNPDQIKDRSEDEAEVIIGTVEKLARRLMDDLLMGRGGCVEEGHVLLQPFLAVLELALCHRFKKNVHELWKIISLIKVDSDDLVAHSIQSNVDNVRGFTLLRTGLSKLRAWLRLALMSKTCAVCLSNLKTKVRYMILLMLSDIYENGAAMEHIDSMISVLKSLDSVDFNLYVREQEIDKMKSISFESVVQNGKINWAALGCEDISLEEFDHEIEVRKLKATLVQQINQRTFFQEECRRLQQKCALVQEQLECVIVSSKHLAHENASLQQCIEAHEATNIALQRQLAATFLGEGGNDAKIRKKAVKIAFEEEKTQRQSLQKELEMEKQKGRNLELKLNQMMDGRKQESVLFEERTRELTAKLELVTKLKDEMRKHMPSNK